MELRRPRGNGPLLLATATRYHIPSTLAVVSFGGALALRGSSVFLEVLALVVLAIMVGWGYRSCSGAALFVSAAIGGLTSVRWPLAMLPFAVSVAIEHRREMLAKPPFRILGFASVLGIFSAAVAVGLTSTHIVNEAVSVIREEPDAFGLPLVLVVPVAAASNAGVEEFVWRGGLLRDSLNSGASAGTALAAQAISFGLAHRAGIPGGPEGMIATAAFGLASGVLVLATPRRSLVGALLAHFVADVAIVWSIL